MSVKANCNICGKSYVLGVNGIIDGCDACLGIKRDAQGNYWTPEEQQIEWYPVDGGAPYIETREEAFR